MSRISLFLSDWSRRLGRANHGDIAWPFVMLLILHGVGASLQQLMWLLGIFGLYRLFKQPTEWLLTPGNRRFWLLLTCLILPAALSLIDSNVLGRSFSTVLRLVFYGMAGYVLMGIAPRGDQWSKSVLAVLAVIGFWIADGLLQEVVGFNSVGISPMPDPRFGHRISGLLGRDYGATLAILSPLVFEAVRLHYRRWPVLALAVPLLAFAITISGSRNAMVLLLVSAVFYLSWASPFRASKRPVLVGGALLLALILGMGVPVILLPHLMDRMLAAWAATANDWEAFSTALSFRPSLWVAAWQVFLDNPVNGVGVRGSGLAMMPLLEQSPLYSEFVGAIQDNWFPHWVLLEVLADMGVLGLLGYCAFVYGLIRSVRGCSSQTRVFALITLLAFFPFSTTLALFSFQATLLGIPALAFAMAARSGGRRIELARWSSAESLAEAREPQAREPQTRGKPRVLIVRLSAIGDVVFASPLIRSVHRRFPNAEVSWLAEPVGAPLLKHNEALHEVIVWDKNQWLGMWREGRYFALLKTVLSFRRDLRARQFDAVFDVQGLLKSAVLTGFTGAFSRIGFTSKEPTALFHTHQFSKRSDARLISSEYRGFAEDVGLSSHNFDMEVALSAEDRELARDELALGRFAIICPFTTRPQKHWRDDHWFELAELVDRSLGLRVLMLGGPADVEHGQRLAEGSVIQSRVGTQSLTASAALISRASLLVGVDTGLTHMGIAFDVPTVALFGSTCPYSETTRENARVIYHDLPCAPCRRNPSCNGKFQCLTEITPEEVMSVARKLPGVR